MSVVYRKRCLIGLANALDWSSREARNEPSKRNGMVFDGMRKRGWGSDGNERTAGRS